MNKDILFSMWYDSLEGTKSQGFAYKAWCAGWEAAVLAEREACAKLCEELRDEDGYECWGTECAVAIRTKDMSTKPQNVNTSEERVHESDKSIHDDDDIQEYKKPWVGLSAAEVAIYSNVFDGIHLVREIEAVLKERNT